MDLLDKTTYNSKEVLMASDMTNISGKINEIVRYLNQESADTGYSVSVTVGDGSTNIFYFLQSETQAILEFAVSTQTYSKRDSSSPMVPYFEDYTVKIEIDRTSTGSYITIANDTLLANDTYSIDIRKYLSSAQSRLRATFTGKGSGISQTWNGYAQLTTLSLVPESVGWNNPVIENQSYKFGPFTVTGALSKTVFVNVTGNGYSKSYTAEIGTSQYNRNYYFTGLTEFPSTGTGIYNVEIYVRSGTLESAHYSYNLMFISASGLNSTRLVCINEVGTDVVNGSECYLLSYALYSNGGTSGTVEREIQWSDDGGETIAELMSDEVTESTGEKHIMNYSLDVPASGSSFDMSVYLTIGGNTSSQSYSVSNASNYPAVSVATFYMNAATRSNAQANRENIVNEAAKGAEQKEYAATWTQMAFVDGMDGWTLDSEGRSCLAINAGSKVTIQYSPFANLSQTGKAIEILYKVRNISDYGEDIITAATDLDTDEFTGLRIRPDEICIHTNSLSVDSKQSYHLQEDDMVHAVVSIAPNYMVKDKTSDIVNLVQLFVNGAYKCEFNYGNTDSFGNASLILGSNTADLYVYAFRVYNRALSADDAHTNYVASLRTTAEKKDAQDLYNSVLDSSNNISIEEVAKTANYFVIEMTDRDTIPNYMWAKSDTAHSNFEMHFHDHPEDNWKIYNVETSGQGTTSMGYWRWNLRWRIDKTTTMVGTEEKKKQVYVQYWDSVRGDWQQSVTLSKAVKFDSEHNIDVKRITAKKNYASSTQSHKMGTTAAYNDLHDVPELVGPNEVGGRTAVFQVPAYGFAKYPVEGMDNEYYYEFIGLFTIGPDKGDKPTFKYDYDDETFENSLITMEGLDHDKKLTVFRYPWYDNTYEGNGQVTFEKECLAIDLGDSNYENGWEVGNCSTLTTDGDADDDAQVLNYLKQEFKPAYDIAYLNSPFIVGLNPSEYTLEGINANVTNFGLQRNENDNYRPLSHYEFYFDGEYDLYYLNVATRQYEKKKENANLLVDLQVQESELSGLSLVQKDERFRELRRQRFKTAMDASDCPWHLNDTLFHHVFLTIFGATDNHAKNSYPYRMTGKWRWRQDDLDTIFDTDNQGYSAKKYSIEFKDWTDSSHSAYVYKGEDSAFWTLIEQCYEIELRTMGQKMLEAMVSIGGRNTGANATTLEKLMQFFQTYYWGKAQDYFTKSAYNEDTKYSYEEAFRYHGGDYGNTISPLEQAHGDSLENEKRWVEKRMIYCMSKYRVGPFKANQDDYSLGSIGFRTQSAQDYVLTPAMDIYPCIMPGTGASYGARTFDGNTCTIYGIGGGNTQIFIKGADYLRSIGDLCKLEMDPTANRTITVSSKMLETIKVGDVDRSVMYNGDTYKGTNVQSLDLQSCPSLLTLDARYTAQLSGSLNLTNCPRIRKVWLKGSNVSGVSFAPGCKVDTYQLSDNTNALVLKDLKYLTSVDASGCATKIQTVNISGCDNLDSFQLMYNIWGTQGNVLNAIRVTDVNVTGNDSIINMLYNISQGLDCNGESRSYSGIDASGTTTATPYINGVLSVDSISTVYYDAITDYFPNLRIDGTPVAPSKDDIGLELVGDTSAILENNTPVSRQFTVNAAKTAYKAVRWSVIYPASIEGVDFSSDGLLKFNVRDIAASNNSPVSRAIRVSATSVYNDAAAVYADIQVTPVIVNTINVSLAKNKLLTGESTEVSAALNPSNNTKGKYLAFRSEDSTIATVDQNRVVTPVTNDYAAVNIIGYLDFGAESSENIFGTARLCVNDSVIINTTAQSEFTTLMTYIKGQGWSASNSELYRSEAEDVTTLNTKLKGNTSLYDFSQFEYFTGVTSLNSYEFQNCTNLSEIKFPTSILYLGRYVFQGCTSLKTLYFPSSIEPSDLGSFAQNSSIETITVNGTITQNGVNGGYLCYNDTSLQSLNATKLTLDTSVVRNAFASCTTLSSLPPIAVTSRCTSMHECFNGCRSLQSIQISSESDFSRVTDFHSMCNACISLSDTSFLDLIDFSSATTVAEILGGCTSITTINKLDWSGVSSVSGAFSGCTSLKSISSLKIDNRCTNSSSLFANCKGIQDWNALLSECDFSGVTNASSMFSDCTTLRTLPEGLGLNNMTDISYIFRNSGITSLPSDFGMSKATSTIQAFQNCSALLSINTSGLQIIQSYMFQNCTRLSGTMDLRDCTSIASYGISNCTAGLTFILPDTPPSLAHPSSCFQGTSITKMVVRTSSVLNAYSSATNWGNYVSKMVVDASYFE